MKKLLLGLIFLPAISWASFQPITGSTITMTAPNNNTTAIPVSVAVGSTITIINPAGVAIKTDGSAVTQPVSGTFWQITQPVSVATPYTVIQTTQGVNASTIAVVNAGGVAIKVDGSAVTQPVSVATPFTVIITSSGVNGSTTSVVNAAGTKLLVTPDSVALPANQSVNVSQINAATPLMGNGTTGTGSQRVTIASDNTPFTVLLGTITVIPPVGTNLGVSVNNAPNIGTVTTLTGITNALPTGTNNIGTVTGSTMSVQLAGGIPADGNSGNKSGGTLRVVLATDQPALTNKLLVTPDSVALPANQSVNESQINGATPLMGNGTTGTGSQRVTIASDNTAFSVLVGTVTVINPIGTQQGVTGVLANNGVAAATNRVGTLPAIVQTSFSNGTALTALRDAALSVGTDGNLWVGPQPPMSPSSYYASTSSPSYTTSTDLACLPGNATNTVIVRKITVSCTQTTAGVVTLSLLRRSSADSGGTSASMKVGKDDSTFGSAVSVPLVYSAAPTRGTLDTMVDSVALGCMATGTTSPNDIQVWNFTDKAKVLRGTAQEFCVSLAAPIDLAGTTVTGGNFNVHFAWDEITTITP